MTPGPGYFSRSETARVEIPDSCLYPLNNKLIPAYGPAYIYRGQPFGAPPLNWQERP